jgi:hypothetical protein
VMTKCAECEKNITRKDESFVAIDVKVALPRTNTRYRIVARIFLHQECYKRVGLAGRWKELQDG